MDHIIKIHQFNFVISTLLTTVPFVIETPPATTQQLKI